MYSWGWGRCRWSKYVAGNINITIYCDKLCKLLMSSMGRNLKHQQETENKNEVKKTPMIRKNTNSIYLHIQKISPHQKQRVNTD